MGSNHDSRPKYEMGNSPARQLRETLRGSTIEGAVATALEWAVPIAIRYRVAGLLNGDAHTAWFQTLAGRRSHAELAHFAPISRASDSGIPVALPTAVAAAIETDSAAELGVRTMAKDRVAVPIVAAAFAVLFLGLGTYLGARPSVDPQQELATLRAEIALLRKQQEVAPTRTAAIVADVKRQLQTEMGLLPLTLIRDRRQSFVELHSYDDRGASSYGTAGYLGNGYFITVKHGVIALGQEDASDPRVINSVKLMIDGRPISARVVDAGDARVEVDPGDWAILKVKENIDLPALNVGLNYQFEFADPIFRLGNDYSKGIVVSTGYVGQRTPNKLVTCLTDGHPGVSGGGVLNGEGRLVGIPIGRMQGDFRFSFILPLRDEMFRKVKFGSVGS